MGAHAHIAATNLFGCPLDQSVSRFDGSVSGFFKVVAAFVGLDGCDKAADMAAYIVAAALLREAHQCLILAKVCSIGLRSGEYGGRYQSLAAPSDSAKRWFLRPSVIARSFCPCRAGNGSSLPVASVFWLHGASSKPDLSAVRRAKKLLT
jgi:hypothetical protein